VIAANAKLNAGAGGKLSEARPPEVSGTNPFRALAFRHGFS
jgi:hypothetical protein